MTQNREGRHEVLHEPKWRFPIPRNHTYAIVVLSIVTLLGALILPAPQDLEQKRNQWVSVGRVPDNHQWVQNIIYSNDPNATESIDDETISDEELLKDEDPIIADAFVEPTTDIQEKEESKTEDISTPTQEIASTEKDIPSSSAEAPKEISTPTETVIAKEDTSAKKEETKELAKDEKVEEKKEIQIASNENKANTELYKKFEDIAAEFSTDWYEQNVLNGDNIFKIFTTLNLSYDNIAYLEKTPKYGKTIKNLHPGDKLYFMLNEKNNIIEFIKPHGKNKQIHFVRTKNDTFIAKVEDLNSHLINGETGAESLTAKSTENLTETISAREAAEKKIKEMEKERDQKLQAHAPQEDIKKDDHKPKIINDVLTFKIKSGQNLISAATDNGLTTQEAYILNKVYKGRLNLKRLQPGDQIKVLFDDADKKDKRVINAISIKSKVQGEFNTFMNLKDKKFYDENGSYTRKIYSFNRHPIKGNIRITSNFNPHRRHPITRKIRPHNGTDYGVKTGTPIYAPADGVVIKSTYQRAAGKYLVIQHRGSYSTVYMHLSKLLVKAGEKVKQNQRIALSGNTGRSTGPHLHYELRINNKPVNAMKVTLPSSKTPAVEKANTNLDKKFKQQIAFYKKKLNIK
ncbi:MAG: peptidoglycan DD-metalloendopeptidase family protein [Ruminobacter sp.]|nr:peptidoglycan DD-metalloendopeptidase family protein [Ruminobacter sp.]